MARKLPISIIIFCGFLLAISCQPSTGNSRAFYYWKSQFALSPAEQKELLDLGISKLYIKFFDVTWNEPQAAAQPAAKLRSDSSSLNWLGRQKIELIPTVFITNQTLLKLTDDQLPGLAGKINALLESLLPASAAKKLQEIQLDCDWTAQSKDRYFQLLTLLRQQPLFKDRSISATIRLYQCKYSGKTGIPPVNKGLLMCYNMGNLKNPQTNNSILETAELNKYSSGLHNYPLPLDIALPLFEWRVLFRNNSYAGLINDLPDQLLESPDLASTKKNRSEILKDTLLNGYALKKGDVLRKEDSRPSELLASLALLGRKLPKASRTLALYHFDSITLSKISRNDLENIYSSLP